MENKIVIILTSHGMIMGKISEGEVINPRAMVTRKETGVGFSTLVGNPEVFFIGKSPYYISENAELNEKYEEAINPPKLIIA
jgi:hypothetical protein